MRNIICLLTFSCLLPVFAFCQKKQGPVILPHGALIEFTSGFGQVQDRNECAKCKGPLVNYICMLFEPYNKKGMNPSKNRIDRPIYPPHHF